MSGPFLSLQEIISVLNLQKASEGNAAVGQMLENLGMLKTSYGSLCRGLMACR